MAGIDDIDYEVDHFLDRRHIGPTVEYLVRWKGFNSDWDSWEPFSSLGNCKSKIKLFEKHLKKITPEQSIKPVKMLEKKKMARKKDVVKVLAVKIRKKSMHQKATSIRKSGKQQTMKNKEQVERIMKSIDDTINSTMPYVGDEISSTGVKSKKKSLQEAQTGLSPTKKNQVVKKDKLSKLKGSSGRKPAGYRQRGKAIARQGKEGTANVINRKRGGTINKSQENDLSAKAARIEKVVSDLASITNGDKQKKSKILNNRDIDEHVTVSNSSDGAPSSTGKMKQKKGSVTSIKGDKRKLSVDAKGSVKKRKSDISDKTVSKKSKVETKVGTILSPKVFKKVQLNNKGLKTLPSPKCNMNQSFTPEDHGEVSIKSLNNKNSPKSSLNKKLFEGNKEEMNKTPKTKLNTSLSAEGKGGIKGKSPKMKKSPKALMNESLSSPEDKLAVDMTNGQSSSPSAKMKKVKKINSLTPSKKRNSPFKLSIANLIGLKKMDQTKHISGIRKAMNSTNDKKTLNKFSTKGLKHTKWKHKPNESAVDMLIDNSDDEDILYSLPDTENVWTHATDENSSLTLQQGKVKGQSVKPVKDGKSPKKTKKAASTLNLTGNSASANFAGSAADLTGKIGKFAGVTGKTGKSSDSTGKSGNSTGRSKTKKIRLLDSLKQSPNKLVGPVSPNLLYTTVKNSGLLSSGLPRSSQPIQSHLPWTIPQEGMVHPSSNTQASLPISPASMSYKVLLENLPHQLHPKKNKKKSEEEEDVERRLSVRASECAFKYKEILIKKCNRFTQIWLNTHTQMKNVLNPLVIQEIISALNAARYDDSNLVMVSGLGNVFCSGIDLHYLTTGDKKIAARKMVDALRDLVKKFITFPKLLVAVVTGPAIGLGSALLPLCDIVYASDKASFYMPYAELSQTPEGCASYTLPDCVGLAMANELLIGGRKITAIEACQLGLVSQVYWPTSMMQEVIPRVQHMALLSGKVLETTKLLMRSQQRTKLEHANDSECNLLLDIWPSMECQRAIEQYLSNEKHYLS